MSLRRRCYSFLLAFFLTISLALPAARSSNFVPVPGDIQDHWCKTAVYPLLQRGITYTQEDGLYYPDEYITKAEAACLLYNLIQKRALETGFASVWPLPYGDVAHWELQGSWASPILETMSTAGILLPNNQGSYNIYACATRGDVAEMIFRAGLYGYLVLPPSKKIIPGYLPDVDGLPNCVELRDLCARGILDIANGFVSPSSFVTRAEMSVFLVRAGQYPPMEPPEIPPAPTVGVSTFLPISRRIDVPYTSQYWPDWYRAASEPVCLYMALQYRGATQDFTLNDFMYYLPRDFSNPARGFVGSPYDIDSSEYAAIYPAVLSEYGRYFYLNVFDFSGATPELIQNEVLSGNPVIAYVTLWWGEPQYAWHDIDGEPQSLVSNSHAVLVTGYNSSTGQYHITDPCNILEGGRDIPCTYWVDGAVFNRLYNPRRHAVVIR